MINETQKTIDRIEADLRKLSKLTGSDHINAVLVNGAFMLDDYTDLPDQKFSVFRREGNDE